MGAPRGKSGSKPATPRYGKSGQQSKAPAYGSAMQGATNWGGQALQGGSGKGNGAPSGSKGTQPFQAPGYGQASTGAAAPSGNWQNYAGMTANPNPSMPPQIGAPQTGAFPYPQQRAAGGYPSDAGSNRHQPGYDPGQKQSLWNPTSEFYDQVNQILGKAKMAMPGQYDQGWNAESGPNSRAQAAEDAKKMEAALGRPLTRYEQSQLAQRALGWGFFPQGTNSLTGAAGPATPNWAQLGQDIQNIQNGQAQGPSFGYAPR